MMKKTDTGTDGKGPRGGTARHGRVYCTYFDVNYLPRGMAMWRSLQRVSPDAVLWVCCFDMPAFDILTRLALPRVHVFTIADVERHFPELLTAKPSRSRVEYFFTCTPSVVRYVLDHAADAAEVTYLDADLFFFADPEPLFVELENADGAVGIIGHRFPERLRSGEVHGLYNVGWITFVRDPQGLRCLDDWRRKCVEWCYDREEDGRYADQKYLDAWPGTFDGVVVLQHIGANVALWNVERWQVGATDGAVTVDGQRLLFYHFHGLTPLSPWLFHTYASAYGLRLDRELQRLVYLPYLRVWREIIADLGLMPQVQSNRTGGPADVAALVRSVLSRPLKEAAALVWGLIKGRGEYLFVWR
jgi:hypothetical protein